MTSKSTGENYTYDIQGNLTSIIGNDINQSFTYNGNSNRLSKTVDGETTYYVNDLNQRYEQVVQTYDSNGNVIDAYTYGLQRIDSKGQTTETYLYDGRGSVTGSVGTDHSFASYSYTAYGELMPNSPQPQIFGYNAEATDFETGMQYLRARYYDTSTGRFTQEDIYRGEPSDPRTLNRYIYVYSNPVNYIDKSGFRPVELTTENKHTMEQVKQTTHDDLLKEYQKKKQEAIARSQSVELSRLQRMKENDIQNSVNVGEYGANIPADTLAEVIGNCSFDQINAMIYDDMDFSIYSLTELQSLYDRIDALDVDKKAFDSVNNKNKFMRQLKRYINDNAPKEEKENSFDLGTFISGNAFLIGGAIAIAICATVLTGGAAAPFVIAAAVGLAGGTASMFIGGAEIVESFTGDNYIKDGIFEGNEEKYNTAKTVVAITTAVATAVAAVPAIIANLTTTAVTTGTATGTATVKIVDTYANLKKTTAGMGLEVHHIVEKRFLPAINMANPNSMLSVALSKAEHQIYTNAWRAAFPYGQQVYGDIAKSELWKVAQKIYENFPELMEAAKQTIFN